MSRALGSSTVQENSRRLRNDLCALAGPTLMAQVSSHLRNFAVAEAVGFIAMLDGHPKIRSSPRVGAAGAAFQQAQGTRANPLAHAMPADLLLDGDSLATFFHSNEAQEAVRRAFGMGVMAPEEWQKHRAFRQEPRQNNVVDWVAERHRYGGGLVDAFKASGEAAVKACRWDGSGIRRHNLDSLAALIRQVYRETWVPGARAAYISARKHFAAQLTSARPSEKDRILVLTERAAILEAQLDILEKETEASPEAARNVWKAVSAETWL